MISNTIDYIRRCAIPAALQLLPDRMDSPQARAMLLAIALQESNAAHRVQVGGPAHGFCQFERGFSPGAGVRGVHEHMATKGHLSVACQTLRIEGSIDTIYEAITNCDPLAFAVARLLLWTDARRLPVKGEADYAWQYYLNNWRPGKPHPGTWTAHYETAWRSV